MSDSKQSEWYTNKDLFEKLFNLKDDFTDLRSEMKETRALIKSYNGLREEIAKIRKESEAVKEEVQLLVNEKTGAKAVMNNIRNWGGWMFALITLIVLLTK